MPDNESISSRMHRKAAELKEQQWQDLSIAEKLTVRALEQKITIPFSSEHGSFNVVIRLPTLAEYDFITTFQVNLRHLISIGDAIGTSKMANEMYEIMANLCLDDSMDVEFFKSGCMSGADFAQLVKEALQEHMKRVDEARSFRDEKPGNIPTMRKTRKTTA